MIYLLFLLVLLSLSLDSDYYRPKWLFVYAIAGIICCVNLIDISIFLSIFMGYLLCSSFYPAFVAHFTHKPTYNVQSAFQMTQTYLATIAISLILLLMRGKDLVTIIQWLPVLTIIGSIWTLITPKIMCKRKGYPVKIYGFGANPSVDATLLSLLSSLSLLYPTKLTMVSLVIVYIAIIRTKAAIGLGGFCAAMLVFFFPISVFTLPVLALVLYIIYRKNPKFFSLSGRKEIYSFIIKETKLMWNPLFGIGLGCFRYVFPVIQKQRNVTLVTERMFFLWAHSDVLEFVVSCGIVGCIIFSFLFREVLTLSIHNRGALAFIACWIVNSCGNFNNHLAPDTVISSLFLSVVYS